MNSTASTPLHPLKRLIKAHCPGLVALYHQFRKSLRPLQHHEVLASVFSEIQQTTSDVFFVEIGAMDGVSFDPLYQYVMRYGWRGLLIEPLPDLFEQLRRNYDGQRGLSFENIAISEETGTRVMYRVNPDAIEQGLVPRWAKGISSFFNDRNALGGLRVPTETFEQMRPYITKQSVSCDTLARVFERHGVQKIDVLVMDVEGYDFHVLRQLDFGRFLPHVIMMEWYNLPHGEKKLTLQLLKKHGYHTAQVREDAVENLVAWQGSKIRSI
jgi:FkbM family methyltransferase